MFRGAGGFDHEGGARRGCGTAAGGDTVSIDCVVPEEGDGLSFGMGYGMEAAVSDIGMGFNNRS